MYSDKFAPLARLRSTSSAQELIVEDSIADFVSRPRTAIYASDLSRALTTAKNVHKQNKTDPPPPLTISPLLREQFFGLAEGSLRAAFV